MRVTTELDDKAIQDAIKDIGLWSAQKRARVIAAVEETTFAIHKGAVEKAPADTGLGRARQLRFQFSNGGLLGEVIITGYMVWVELGTRPHFPPVRPLQRWAKRKGFDNPDAAGWAIARKIAEKGTEPQPFLRPSADEQRRLHVRRMEEAMKNE